MRLGIDEAGALTDLPGPHLIEPDRMQDRQEPAIEARARLKLVGAFERSQAGRLDEVLGDVAPSAEHKAVAPEANQMVSQPISDDVLRPGGAEPGHL